jgi:hypothetical protein
MYFDFMFYCGRRASICYREWFFFQKEHLSSVFKGGRVGRGRGRQGLGFTILAREGSFTKKTTNHPPPSSYYTR